MGEQPTVKLLLSLDTWATCTAMNKRNRPGRGHSIPLRYGDQTKAKRNKISELSIAAVSKNVYLCIMGEWPLYSKRVEIRVRIFRRDFPGNLVWEVVRSPEISSDAVELRRRGSEFSDLARRIGGEFMSRNSGVTISGDLDSLPSWISDHLGEGSSFMTAEVNQSPASPIEGSPPPETNPLAAIHPSVEEKTNIMTLEELDALREAYSFPPRVRVRLPEEGETITSTRPGKVAFYEAAFPVGLHFPLHPTIRLIVQFYNICPAQLVPNAWRSIVCSMAMWRVFKYTLSLSEFRNLFSLNSYLKLDQGWLYFKARNKKALLGGYPNNVKVWKNRALLCTGAAGVEIILPLICFLPDPWLRGLQARNVLAAKRRARQVTTELRRILPHIPDLTLLRWSGGKVFDPIFNRNPNSGSNPSSESCSDSSQPVELDSDAMSKRISFKKLGEKLEKSKNGSSSGIPAPAKGVVIGEKRARENLASSASKRGKADDGSKGKGVDREPEGKKKATSPTNAPTTASSRPGYLGHPWCRFRSHGLYFGQPIRGREAIAGGDSPGRQGKGREANLGSNGDEAFSFDRPGRLGSRPSLQEGRTAFMETEVARLQKLSADLEQQLAEAQVREQQANDELAKTKSDRDSLANKVERSGVLVVELREALSKAKESAVEEFKSLSKFMVAIEDSACKYFGEGFDFCKVQLRRHHPDLAIDLEGTMVDQDLLAEQDEAAEEKEKEKVSENEGGEKDTTPL
ncbi:hypothetical protein Acr_08g0010390 [Actinidia rufa]|uniref:Uncharacterized protein n=1 Tax=Actinidia rufa TaxID=165716 RepID=A0A7J0F213_9ERIC|nr:hypothetical protein Acr_08g0010390 [Actinidia rufa]